MAIKDVLPKMRAERGMTQQDLARKLYVTRQAVSRWETDETTPGMTRDDAESLMGAMLPNLKRWKDERKPVESSVR